MDKINLFTTSASLSSGGPLVFDKDGPVDGPGPVSVVQICKTHNIKRCYNVENCFTDYFLAYKNLSEIGVEFIFGIKMLICNDLQDKSTESILNTSKIIIFGNSYKDLVKLYSKASIDGIYLGKPRIDYKHLKELWTDNLLLVIPFYDSFLYKNHLTFSNCVPDFGMIEPLFCVEDNGLPCDMVMKPIIESQKNIVNTKTIYYYKKEHYKNFLVYRCMLSGSIYEKPDMDGMYSNNFAYIT